MDNSKQSLPLSGKKTILVLDDEEVITEALSKKLEVGGYNVLVQRNGEDGLKVALSEHPDLILLDMIMPKMDGITFLDQLRANGEWGKNVPVIVLTNLESGEQVQKSKDRGVYDYLVKTNWTLSDVLSIVNHALS
jgi:CheY-like chemotaxis protein